MNIAFIGFGEVGYEMSQGFAKQGAALNIYAYDVAQSAKSEALSDNVNLTLTRDLDELFANDFELLMVAVPAKFALPAWQGVADKVKAGTVLVDLTTASSQEKQQIDALFADKGLSVVDGAILGPLKLHQHTVPILASGKNAPSFASLGNALGMKISTLNDVTGDATNFKFVRSIYTKGLASLLFETLSAAEKLGISDEIYASIVKTMDETNSFADIIARMTSGTVTHANRRISETENVIDFLTDNGLPSEMTHGTKAVLERIDNKALKQKIDVKTADYKTIMQHYNG